jgi:hypothetical protein
MYISCKKKQFGDIFGDEPATSRIVLKLADPLLDKGYTVYVGNWYTRLDLVDKMCHRKIDRIGTVRLNKRGVVEKVEVVKLKIGQSVVAFRRKQMIMKWEENTPAVVINYSKDTGGVDSTDN